jgi:uncharacterized RDD family membrane protein YckC
MELKHNISKFWTRIGAFIIDFLIIGILGFIIGIIFEDFFVSLGNHGLLFGLIITIIYFSIANSKITNGQTIGKKIVKIKTINASGNALSLKTSLLRSLILFTPYFLINYPIPGLGQFSALDIYKSSILTSTLIGIAILYIANKSTRQSLHDMLMGTYVVNVKENEDVSEIQPNKKVGIIITLVVTFIMLLFSTFSLLLLKPVINGFEDLIGEFEDIDGVLNAGISRNTTTFFGDEKSITESYTVVLHVQKIPNRYDFDQSEIVKEAVEVLFLNTSDGFTVDIIKIQLTKGFNIGIAKKHNSYSSSKSPEEWAQAIE